MGHATSHGLIFTQVGDMKNLNFKNLFYIFLALCPFTNLLTFKVFYGYGVVRILMLALIALGLFSIKLPKKFLSKRGITFILFLFFVVSIIYSLLEYEVFTVLKESLPFILMLVCLLCISVREYEFYSYLKFLSLVGAVSGIFAFFLYFNYIKIPTMIDFELQGITRTGSLIDGVAGVVGAFSSFYLVATRRGNVKKLIYSIAFLFSLTNVFLSGFRTYLLMVIIFIFLSIVFSIFTNKLIGKKFIIASILVIFAFIGLVNFGNLTNVTIDRFLSIDRRVSDNSLDWRKIELGIELDAIFKKPVFGNGWGFSARHEVYNKGYGTLLAYGHNQYTSLAARIGLPLAIAYWSLIFSFLIEAFRQMVKTDRNHNVKIRYVFVFSLTMSVIIGGITQNFMIMTLFLPSFTVFWANDL